MPPLFQPLATCGGERLEKWYGWDVFDLLLIKNLAHARQASMGPMQNRDVLYNEPRTGGARRAPTKLFEKSQCF